MPNVKDYAIAFCDDPTSGLIPLHNSDWTIDIEGSPVSDIPPWAAQYQSSLSRPVAAFETPGLSRELALAAARQLYRRRVALLTEAQNRLDTVLKSAIQSSVRDVNDESISKLRKADERIRFLESQLESQRHYLQLFRLGAGSLFIAVLSLVVWLITGIGIPFHPVFAVGVIPVAIGVIVMGFWTRPVAKQRS